MAAAEFGGAMIGAEVSLIGAHNIRAHSSKNQNAEKVGKTSALGHRRLHFVSSNAPYWIEHNENNVKLP
jgi:hypothetical protein